MDAANDGNCNLHLLRRLEEKSYLVLLETGKPVTTSFISVVPVVDQLSIAGFFEFGIVIAGACVKGSYVAAASSPSSACTPPATE